MANEQRRPLAPLAKPDRRFDIESLAASIYSRRVCYSTGKTQDSLAAEALTAARAFFRVCDEPTANQE